MNRDIFLIAEAGVNHNGDLNLALEMIDAAKDSGADAVKFQTFEANTLATRSAIQAKYQTENSGIKESQYDMLRKLELKKDYHEEIKRHCEKNRVIFMSSPFDEESVKFLNNIQMEIFKIPSGEITNKPILQSIAKIGKPTILSTGMSNLKEIHNAIKVFKEEGFDLNNLSLLHATSDYPADPSETNMLCIKTLKDEFKLRVGYSDHTNTSHCAIIALALGASIFEKHFTLDRKMNGPDHKASLEPEDLKQYFKDIKDSAVILGDGKKIPGRSESKNINIVRKSIVAKKRIDQGEVFTSDNITTKRPGNGISPMNIDLVLGQSSKKKFDEDDLIEI